MQKEKQTSEIFSICSKFAGNSALRDDFARYERFYLGEQWENGEYRDKPVFNIIKRVCDYVISTLCAKDFSVSYTLDGAPYSLRSNFMLNNEVECLSKHISYKFDKEVLERLVFYLVRDAVIYGTGFLYTYWDSAKETGTLYKGDIETLVLDPARVIPSNPKQSDIQKQKYIVISGREDYSELAYEARLHGKECEEALKKLAADDGFCDTQTVMFKSSGKVMFIKKVEDIIVSNVETELTHFPLSSFTPIPIKNSFFGKSHVEGMMGNQLYINRSYAMLMKHMEETAFSKVIYDASRIPEWRSEPGIAIAAHGGGNLSDCVSVVGCGKLEDGYISLTGEIAERTKELYGATETALGNVEPTNTSAIMAVREASEAQLRGMAILLTSSLEEQARIWADFMLSYYGYGRKLQFEESEEEYSFGELSADILRCRIQIEDRSKYGSSVALAVLDKLLERGAISADEYIDRLPDGIIPNKEVLARSAKIKEVFEDVKEEKDEGK